MFILYYIDKKILFLLMLVMMALGINAQVEFSPEQQENNPLTGDFICEDDEEMLKKPYIQINKKKFFDGETAYVCLSRNNFLKAYKGVRNPKPLGDNIQWSDNVIVFEEMEHYARFEAEMTSSSLEDKIVVTASSGNKSVSINLVTVAVKFSPIMDETFPFDDNKISVYPSYNTLPTQGLPWQLVPVGESVKMNYSIEPLDAYSIVEFKGQMVDIDLQKPSSGQGELNIMSSIGNTNATILARINDSECYNDLKVASYERRPEPINVGLIKVNEDDWNSTANIDQGLIESDLSTIYNPYLIDFQVNQLPDITMDFDLNNDGILQASIAGQNITETDENNFIRLNCSPCISSDNDMYFLFVAPSDDDGGRTPHNQQISIIFGNDPPTNTIPHELGHGIFGLIHPFQQFGDENVQADRGINLMMYPSGNILRKYQWDQIHNN